MYGTANQREMEIRQIARGKKRKVAKSTRRNEKVIAKQKQKKGEEGERRTSYGGKKQSEIVGVLEAKGTSSRVNQVRFKLTKTYVQRKERESRRGGQYPERGVKPGDSEGVRREIDWSKPVAKERMLETLFPRKGFQNTSIQSTERKRWIQPDTERLAHTGGKRMKRERELKIDQKQEKKRRQTNNRPVGGSSKQTPPESREK